MSSDQQPDPPELDPEVLAAAIRLAAEALPCALAVLLAETGRVAYANPALCMLFGVEREQVVSARLADLSHLVHPDDLAGVLERFARQTRADSGLERFEVRILRAGQELRFVEAVASRVDLPGVAFVQVTLLDVTEAHQRDQALRASEARYRNLFENMNDAGFLADAGTGLLVDANRQAERLLGKSREQITGTHHLSLHPASERERYGRMFQDHASDGIGIDDAEVERADGVRVPVTISTAALDIDGRPHLLGLFHDVSRRRKAELERQAIQRKMLQSQKLESLGVLAGGLAHDFNNLLMGVLGNSELAAQELAAGSQAREYLDQVRQAALQAAELARQLLAYAGRGHVVLTTQDLNAIVSGSQPLLQTTVSGRATLEIQLADGLVPIETDLAQVRQVLLNLISNAAEASEGRPGSIRLETGRLFCDRSCLRACAFDDGLEEGDYAFFQVSDRGCGMDPATLARIFDPFFTTKITGRGLGLAAVLGIVRSHKGTLMVDSRPGEGTRFKVLLPLSERACPQVDARVSDSQWRGQGLALVVDDEYHARMVAAEMLARLGFEVEQHSDGQQALEDFAARPAAFALVLLDLTMPGMGGAELLARMRRLRPDVQVLLSSGYNECDVLDRVGGLSQRQFIQKPFRLADLIAKLRVLFEPV